MPDKPETRVHQLSDLYGQNVPDDKRWYIVESDNAGLRLIPIASVWGDNVLNNQGHYDSAFVKNGTLRGYYKADSIVLSVDKGIVVLFSFD